MANPAGESNAEVLRLDFDRRLMLRGTKAHRLNCHTRLGIGHSLMPLVSLRHWVGPSASLVIMTLYLPMALPGAGATRRPNRCGNVTVAPSPRHRGLLRVPWRPRQRSNAASS
jgi:hypothetical protein